MGLDRFALEQRAIQVIICGLIYDQEYVLHLIPCPHFFFKLNVDILNNTVGEPPAVFVVTKARYFGRDVEKVSSRVCVDKSGYFNTKHDLFLALTKCAMCLNLTRP